MYAICKEYHWNSHTLVFGVHRYKHLRHLASYNKEYHHRVLSTEVKAEPP